MNQVTSEGKHPSCAPVPCIHTPAYQQTSHKQCFGCFQVSPMKFLSEETHNLLSMAKTSAQTPLSLSSTLQYYGETLNCVQHYCMPPFPVGFQGCPVRFLPNGPWSPPTPAVTSTQTPQPLKCGGGMLGGPQQNGKPTSQGPAGDFTACQLRNSSSSLPQGVAGASAHSSKPGEEALQKRELRLMKNREAARECRRKKKEYVKCLENRVAVLENQNKTLIEELRALKDVYRHKVEEASKKCRKRRKEYVENLQARNTSLELENQQLRALVKHSSKENVQTPCQDLPLL